MATKPVNLSLPEELAAELRAKAAHGEIRSVSSYVADVLTERFQREADDEQRRANVEAYVAEYLTPPDGDSNAWASDVLDAIDVLGRDR